MPDKITFADREITDPVQIAMVQKIEALENGKLPMDRMPLDSLKKAILLDEPQDPSATLLPHSVTGNLIAANSIDRDNLLTSAKELFVQLLHPEETKVDLGTAEAEFGGVNYYSDKTVTHGLEEVPTTVLALPYSPAENLYNLCIGGFGSPTSTSFKIRVSIADKFVPGAGTKLPFFWLAMSAKD